MYDIEKENLIPFSMLKISFLDKTQFSGSTKHMRYIIKKEEDNGKKILMVYAYKDKYNIKNTNSNDIIKKSFDFSKEGIEDIKKYLTDIRDSFEK